MDRSPVLLGLASVLAGTTAVFGVFGLVYSPVLLLAAVPFAAATYVVWRHATGRLRPRRRGRVIGGSEGAEGTSGAGRARRHGGSRRRQATSGETGAEEAAPGRAAAARVLDVEPDADQQTIRRAFRARARELHPDASSGDEAAFRRARDAYERLTEGP